MKKLLGIAAFILAFSPFAQAQNGGEGLAGHPDARNDRNMTSQDRGAMVHHEQDGVQHMRHVKRHHAKRHIQAKRHHRIVHAK